MRRQTHICDVLANNSVRACGRLVGHSFADFAFKSHFLVEIDNCQRFSFLLTLPSVSVSGLCVNHDGKKIICIVWCGEQVAVSGERNEVRERMGSKSVCCFFVVYFKSEMKNGSLFFSKRHTHASFINIPSRSIFRELYKTTTKAMSDRRKRQRKRQREQFK